MSSHILFDILFSVLLHRGLGTVNFALHKSAVQSTTIQYNNFSWTADKAVDGNSDGSNPDNSRTCSATIQMSEWVNHTWEVDIGFQIIVKTITVYGRTDGKDHISDLKLFIGNVTRPWIYNQELPSNSSNATQYVFKPNYAIARVISLMRFNRILTICEVTVEGECLGGNVSEFCNITCGRCFDDQPCNKENGTCPLGCDQGWNGTICKESCERGNYGYNCNETCGHCLYGNNSCSTSDGNCTNGCIAGWQDYHCKRECRRGTYGYRCNETCGNCYKGNISCSLTDGRCMEGCEAGWHADICKLKCEAGTYGFNCNETCGHCLKGNDNCSKTDGQCNGGCEVGWTGDACKSGCGPGKYGYNCNETCGNCLYGNNSCSTSHGQCNNGCKAGWQGDDCKKECDTGTYGLHCNETCGFCLNGKNSCSHMNGQCSGGCQAGWMGETCKSECEAGTYSFNCNETCGHCLKGNDYCSKTDGQCNGGCEVGWTGDTCKSECRRGTYGYRCNETCGNCYNGNISCSLTNGSCMEGCEAGWNADICKLKCEAGTYGFNCNETCGHCLKGNGNCSKTDGQCNGGCEAGWTGGTCKSGTFHTTTAVTPNTGVIVGSVLAAVGVSIFAMVIIIVIVKNRRKKHNSETSTDNVTTAAHYVNVIVGNTEAACQISTSSITEKDTTLSAIDEESLQRGMPIGTTNSHSGVMGPDVPVQNVYEKLRDVTETTESAYYTIDHNLINDQKIESMEACSTFVETLQSLESALKSVEEEISVLLDKKEKLLSKELETARANKLRDKRQKKESDKDKDSTIAKFVQALQSTEGELRIVEDKRKCLLGRKEILLRQELAKTTENGN